MKIRSKLIQDEVTKKSQCLRRARFAHECAKLDRAAEQATAEEFFCSEAEWPDY